MKTVIEGFEKYIQKPVDDEYWEDQTLYKFDNGFGASIVFHPGTYGYEQDLVELAVIQWLDDTFILSYDTYLTDDVLGGLNKAQAKLTLQKIKEL
jgi:hypothetical protein